jgi:hypothetical protein|tara:strand:+ start:585 stop:770 length:186 start_codon:yes stop_codon:yes gene_type:complete
MRPVAQVPSERPPVPANQHWAADHYQAEYNRLANRSQSAGDKVPNQETHESKRHCYYKHRA